MRTNRLWMLVALVGLFLAALGAAAPALWPAAAVTRFYAVPLTAGCLALLAALYGGFPVIRSFLNRRSARWGIGTGALVAIVVAVVAVVQIIATDHHKRWDLTKGGKHGLAPQTEKVLDGLKDPVEALAFLAPGEGQEVTDLLGKFAYRSKRFTYRVVDPDREPSLRERYDVSAYGTVVIENKASGKKETLLSAQEERVANALVRVTRAKAATIGWITGHGEGDPAASGRGGYSALVEGLRNQGYEVTTLGPFTSSIPPGISVLVVARPMKSFLAEETKVLEEWMRAGGRMLLLAEPGGEPNLDALLKGYGIAVRDDLIIDPQVRLVGVSGDTPVIATWEDHPIVASFDRTLAVFLPAARSLEILPGSAAKVVASTSPSSWGETDKALLEEGKAAFDEGKDRKGPLPVLAVSTAVAEGKGEPGKEPESRLVVVGDADLASNGYLKLSGNGDLIQNAIAWLAEESDLIAIRARDETGSPIILTRSQAVLITLISFVLIPGLCLAAGVAVWAKRRRLR